MSSHTKDSKNGKQHNKVRIKGKVEESREWSRPIPQNSTCCQKLFQGRGKLRPGVIEKKKKFFTKII